MKVSVVSRSGREVVKGGIELSDEVSAPCLLPGFRSGFKISRAEGLS
jgi:hypothetical protein